jgi:predicted ATPase/class 3 adenylate cyclase
MRAVDSLPAGRVTFVMTDIEGSTRLFRGLGEAYPPLLEEHNALLRQVWATHHGVEVKTAGDSFLVAFASAAEALEGAVAAQAAIAAHTWPSEVDLRVRIGVHTGIAFPHNRDYIALAVHQAARVVGAANGGYVLASEEAVNAAGSGLSVAAQLVGTFRLRDFDKPAHLYSVAPLGASAENVPVRAVPAAGHNLVAPPTTFVGRQEAVAHVASRLAANHLLSIVGPGGMGKTRLAIEVGLRVASQWRDGVWIAELASVADLDMLASVVAEAVGVSDGDRDDRATLIDHLAPLSAVLILDNCEHVVDAVAKLSGDVLSRCPSVAILATSRLPLGIAGEELWRIDPLPISSESVGLFVDRARSASPGCEAWLDEEIVAEICEQLDGMPLAIELAAARMSVLTEREILDGLVKRFRLLKSRDRTVTERQRTIKGLLDWSYDLLDDRERAAFEHLSVFIGSFDLAAATSVLGHGDLDDDEVAELVWSLADHSLLNVDRTGRSSRYRMLTTVRAYAEDRLIESGGGAAASIALAEHYLARFPVEDRGSIPWVNAFVAETETVGALIDRLRATGMTDVAYALAGLLAELRMSEQRFGLDRIELTRAIERATEATPSLARLYLRLSEVEMVMGDLSDAKAHFDIAVGLVEQLGTEDRLGRIEVAGIQAMIAMREESVPELRRAEEALEAVTTRTDITASARLHNLSFLAMVRQQLGSLESALELSSEVSRMARDLGDYVLLTQSLSNSAEYALRDGHVAEAARYQREALELAAEFHQPVVVAFGTIIAARIAEPIGLLDAAVRLQAAADRILEEVEFVLFADDRHLSDEMLARARAQLGDERFAHLEADGRLIPVDQIVGLANEVFDEVAPSR